MMWNTGGEKPGILENFCKFLPSLGTNGTSLVQLVMGVTINI